MKSLSILATEIREMKSWLLKSVCPGCWNPWKGILATGINEMKSWLLKSLMRPAQSPSFCKFLQPLFIAFPLNQLFKDYICESKDIFTGYHDSYNLADSKILKMLEGHMCDSLYSEVLFGWWLCYQLLHIHYEIRLVLLGGRVLCCTYSIWRDFSGSV